MILGVTELLREGAKMQREIPKHGKRFAGNYLVKTWRSYQGLPFNVALVHGLINDETYPEADYLKKSIIRIRLLR